MELRVKLELFKETFTAFLNKNSADLANRISLGLPVPGLKLVAGRANRQWDKSRPVHEIGKALISMGVTEPYETTLIGIGEAEKILGKGRLGGLTRKPEPKLHLVPVDDARPSITKDEVALITDYDPDSEF